MFTPQQIEQISFSRATFGGYDMQSVDELLYPLTEDDRGGNENSIVLKLHYQNFDALLMGDVGAKQEIYQIMLDLLRKNKCILMVSSDMPEMVSMSDRVIVMKEGKIAGTLERDQISEENILQLSIGGSSI